MVTVQVPFEKVSKTWGTQKTKQTAYRLMKFVLRRECGEGTLLHNVVTGELILITEDEAKIFSSLPRDYTEAMDELIAKYFLVPIDFDEKKAVYQLRKILNLYGKKKYIGGYTILPTTNCNARCFYCYEAEFAHVNMTKETADRAIEFIKEHCPEEKKVSLSWFGGEPTVGANRIDQICEGLTAAGIEYHSSMISNGYLFSKEMAEKAKNLWKLNSIQITLDGTEEVYNKVKAYPGVTGSPYKRVLENIGYLLENEVRVSIRMNLDRHNADNLKELIGELADRFGGQKNFSAYVWPLFDDCGFDPVKHEEVDRLWLVKKQVELNSLIEKNATQSKHRGSLPSLATNHCMADNGTSVIINADGTLAKCEHTFASDPIGNIYDGITNDARTKEWMETVEYDDCDSCPLFPKCVNLKYCFSTGKCYADKREKETLEYLEVMAQAYEKWKNKDDNDSDIHGGKE